MAEHIDHARAGAQRRDGRAVLLLVEEEARLLAVLHVHGIHDAVFHHRHAVGHVSIEQARGFLHAFQAAHGHIVALINALWPDHFHQNIGQFALPQFHAQRKHLHHQHAAELVHHQPGQKIRLGIDGAAAVHVAKALAVLPGRAHAPREEIRVDGLVVRGEDAQGDLRGGVVQRAGQERALGAVDLGHARRAFAFHALDFRGVQPGMPAAHAGFPGFAQCNLRHGRILLHSR